MAIREDEIRPLIHPGKAKPVLPPIEAVSAEGVDRRLTGDGTPARYVRSMAAYAAFYGGFCKEATFLMCELAMYTGRRMPNQFGYFNSKDAVNADANLLRERFESGHGTRTCVTPFALTSSGLSSNKDTSIGKSGTTGDGDGQDGD